MTIVQELPRQEQRIRMSYEAFLTQIDEHAHAEWVNGETIIFMPPTSEHQDLSGFLIALLRAFVDFFRLGTILPAPFEMKPTPESNAREPDIVFVAQENRWRLTEKKLEGPADLLIEIISTESVTRDRDDKFYEYQAAGVREYWVIDPRPRRQRADFWVLDAKGHYRPVPLTEDDIYHSTVLPNFWLDVNWLWQKELPDVILTFARIVGPEHVIAALREMTKAQSEHEQ
ncbi:MAG: Uma2 family endonuclease [Caldilineaceae bacterium]